MGKVLVLYHSASGNTARMAGLVAEGAGQIAGTEVRVRDVLASSLQKTGRAGTPHRTPVRDTPCRPVHRLRCRSDSFRRNSAANPPALVVLLLKGRGKSSSPRWTP
jgi:hypothetical protein